MKTYKCKLLNWEGKWLKHTFTEGQLNFKEDYSELIGIYTGAWSGDELYLLKDVMETQK